MLCPADRVTHDKAYIYQKIYKPILEFGSAVDNHVWHFRWYLDGSGKNERAMQRFTDELEKFLIEKTEHDMSTAWDNVEPKLVLNVKTHLAGRCYEIMYGKFKVAKLAKMEAQDGETKNANP